MATDEKKPLGRILLTRKLVSQEELDHALAEQKRTGGSKPLASYLTDTGIVREEDALRALSEQFGVPGIDLSQVAILLEHLGVVPRELAESQLMLPVLIRGERLFLAMSNPSEKRIIDELEFVSGKKVYAYVALSGPLQRAIEASYDAKDRGEKYYLGPKVPKETLARLGLAPPPGSGQGAPAPPPVAPSPLGAPPPPSATPSVVMPAPPTIGSGHSSLPAGAAAAAAAAARAAIAVPEAPPLVLEEKMHRLGASAEVSTVDFGTAGAMNPDVSNVGKMSPEMRAAVGLDPLRDEPEPPTLTRDAKTVLVVDDEEDIRRMLRRVLSDKGYRVVEADRGLLALRLVKEHVPDVIVLDAMLPELHGFDIARRIKGSEKYGSIPIIMISAVYRGWRIAEDLKTAYGIEAYLEKPFRIADVVAAVQRAAAQRDTRKSTHPERDPEAMSADAEKLLEQGVAAYKVGKLDDAIAFLQRGVQIDPLAYRLHYHLALLHGKKGNIYDGIQNLERAIELNPKHFPALKNLAVLYEKAGFRHKAVEMWERCIHVAPDAETKTQVKEHLMSLL